MSTGDLSHLAGGVTREGEPVVARGRVSRAPTSATDSLEVTLEGGSAAYPVPVPAGNWEPRGYALPALNTPCVVLQDDRGDAWMGVFVGVGDYGSSHWHTYLGAGTPTPGTFIGEADTDFAVRTSDGEIFERVAGAWVDQGFSIKGNTGATGATGVQGPQGIRGSLWYSYTSVGTPAAGTFVGEADGDYAIRSSDDELFKRVAGAWVDQNFSIKGAPGSLTGAAGGDLSGNYPNPSVAKIQGQAVSAVAPTFGQRLEWNGTAWSPTIRSTVTALPTSPYDGQVIFYLADATNGIVWQLRYRAGSTSTHKWEFVGGSPLRGSNPAYRQVIFSASTWVAAPGTPNGITLPQAGDYVLAFGGDLRNDSSGNAVVAYLALVLNGVVQTYVMMGPNTAFDAGSEPMLKTLSNNLAAGDVLSFSVQTNSLNATLNYPWVEAQPVRIG